MASTAVPAMASRSQTPPRSAGHQVWPATVALLAAGAVIGLMLSGGAALDAAASRRARRELTRLGERAPRVPRLRVGDALEEVSVDVVAPATWCSCASAR